MNQIYFVLMASHVVGLLVNLRMLVSCLKDQARYRVLQSCRAVLIFQCMLHLAILALNAEESMKLFIVEETETWCTANSIFVISLGFVMVYNLLAMLAIEYHTVLCLRKALSSQAALLGTLIAGISTTGLFYWAGFFTVERLCASQMASTIACSLLLVLVLSIAWHIWWRPVENSTIKIKSFEETSRDLLDLLVKSKSSAFVTCLFLFCVILLLFFEVISSETSLGDIEKIEDFILYERVFYLLVLCFGVGISLPVIFCELIESSTNEKVTADDPSGEKTLSA